MNRQMHTFAAVYALPMNVDAIVLSVHQFCGHRYRSQVQLPTGLSPSIEFDNAPDLYRPALKCVVTPAIRLLPGRTNRLQ